MIWAIRIVLVIVLLSACAWSVNFVSNLGKTEESQGIVIDPGIDLTPEIVQEATGSTEVSVGLSDDGKAHKTTTANGRVYVKLPTGSFPAISAFTEAEQQEYILRKLMKQQGGQFDPVLEPTDVAIIHEMALSSAPRKGTPSQMLTTFVAATKGESGELLDWTMRVIEMDNAEDAAERDSTERLMMEAFKTVQQSYETIGTIAVAENAGDAIQAAGTCLFLLVLGGIGAFVLLRGGRG